MDAGRLIRRFRLGPDLTSIFDLILRRKLTANFYCQSRYHKTEDRGLNNM